MEVGMRMRRGIIAVRGPVRDFAGLQMKGGTIVLMGGAEIRTGAWMVRGTIISPEAAAAAADVLLRLRVQPHVPAAVREAPAAVRLPPARRGERGVVSALHGRHVGAGQGRDPGVASRFVTAIPASRSGIMVDRMREENRQRFGEQNLAVDLIREARDGR